MCRGLGNVKFQVMDALAMEWPDESFDLVWACESGEHMPDKKKYVEEMVRVLKPGGTLVIACWCQREEGNKCAPPPSLSPPSRHSHGACPRRLPPLSPCNSQACL